MEGLSRALYIAKKDIKEYYMKPATMSWGIIFPASFALAFAIKSGGRLGELAPGLIALALFFGSTSMSAASIVFERKIGSFERLLLFPVSYTTIALGKTLSSFLFGVLSSAVTLAIILPLASASLLHPWLLLGYVLLSTFMFSSFGVLVSYLLKDPSQTMTVFNAIRFPMIFLSGIFVPLKEMPLIIRVISLALPLTYSVEAMRYSLRGAAYISPWVSLSVMIFLSIAFLLLTAYEIRRSIP
ncbi:ABC transporter permease [Thermococcus atlanticus]